MKWRTGFVFYLMTACFLLALVRIGTLAVDERVLAVGQTQGAKSVTVATARGTIYDRNGEKLVNDTYEYRATLIPEQALLSAIRPAVTEEMYRLLLDSAKERMPLSVRLNQRIEAVDGLQVFRVVKRYTGVGNHLIGYLDGNGDGAFGIEKAYDGVLGQYSGQITVSFPVNGAGERRFDQQNRVKDTTDNSRGGVMLTVDKAVQETVDQVADAMMDKGAVVVLDPGGDLLALSSRPTYDPEALDAALDDADSPLINRALLGYDSGSVFKIVTAAAALEYGISENQGYVCDGELTVGNTLFHCHNRQGHDLVGMEEAFAKSCNLYFIQLAQAVGGDRLLKMAEKLGFSDTVILAEGVVAAPAVLPSQEDLLTPATLANLSFGQGELLVSPLHIARMTAVFTANGTLSPVNAVRGVVSEDGEVTAAESGREGETVLSAAHTRVLCRMLECVVQSGTGSAAQPLYTTAAGKTGTAETGQLDEQGVPVTQSWFTGYYPADEPRYVVTVLVEDAGNNDYTAAEVFCEISNKLEQQRRNGE